MSLVITDIEANDGVVYCKNNTTTINTITASASIQRVSTNALKITDETKQEVIIYTSNISKVQGANFAGTTQELWALLNNTIFNG